MMTIIEKNIIDSIKDGQYYNYLEGKYIDDYKPLVRKYAGIIREALNTKNPVTVSCVIFDIEQILDIINPKLTKEIDWFNKMSNLLKKWTNDRILTHRVLGIKNDNQ